jgi:hypothetical protein
MRHEYHRCLQLAPAHAVAHAHMQDTQANPPSSNSITLQQLHCIDDFLRSTIIIPICHNDLFIFLDYALDLIASCAFVACALAGAAYLLCYLWRAQAQATGHFQALTMTPQQYCARTLLCVPLPMHGHELCAAAA